MIKHKSVEKVPLCRWQCWDPAETLTHVDMKEVSLGWLHKLWWAPAVARSPGHQTDRAAHKLDCVRPERCLALVHRSWGLEGCNTKQQTMMSSICLSSQSRLEHWGPRRSDYIIPVRLETASCCQTSRHEVTELWGMRLKSHSAVSETLHQCKVVNLAGLKLFIASVNQSIYWRVKMILTKAQAGLVLS